MENLSKWTKNTQPEVFSGVKFNSKTFLFSSLWPKNASKCLKIEFFGKLVNLGQTLTCRDSMGLQLIGLRDPSHLIIYQYVPHMSYAAIRKFLRGYHNHRMCNSDSELPRCARFPFTTVNIFRRCMFRPPSSALNAGTPSNPRTASSPSANSSS